MTTSPTVSRRGVVLGAGVAAAAVAVAGCSTYGDEPTAAPVSPEPGTAAPGAPAPALAKTAEVPVGGGVIVGDTVITQPTPGTYVGLSTTCTHAGCKVTKIQDGAIDCVCHGSKFALDGTAVAGPAKKPLAAKAVRVEGDSIVAG
ncbi:ubiquinol-cytochrome c reductase iron-sulfur subunit [Nocardia sp. NPDC057227]|uniref:QcrA and Rieske domain-containing protein n=1 Tax=Nocardia sp. NPDC057227 TaxID=3346056 RepID=UPI00363D08DD